ncbi:carboxypeptidase-like regulatory domain-containing protein [Flammeovirgaceae bacterium SG7u.111]|nr:carboxypeptidase-like regulatory domain-containing protein [Flammeovirgaceae bacterium SG7u.132]WPO33630.1 carboxypeptidase-like regulatory domain-containing protein [Flammeovirgaceae bacterium SG7u.111]
MDTTKTITINIFSAALLTFIFLFTSQLEAQLLLKQRVNVNWEKKPYSEALEELRDVYGFSFVYSDDQLPSRLLSYQVQNMPLEYVLLQMFKNSKNNFKEINGEIIISHYIPGNPIPKYTINGKVTETISGEELIGVTIWLKGTPEGAISNFYGFYSLTLPEGIYELEFSYLGYKDIVVPIQLDSNITLDMEMKESEIQLEEVEVVGKELEEDVNIKQAQMSIFRMNAKVLKEVPVFFGEPDVIRTIQLLPGVQSIAEGSTGIFVRGGTASQNLLLIDEAPVFNASHFGLFSIFNPDAVKEIEFAKGSIPASYGGRLSSVLDVRMKEGNFEKPVFTGGVGTLSTRLSFEAPLKKDKGSFFVAGRRSYADFFLNSFPSQSFGGGNTLYFYDLNGRFDYRFNLKNKVSVSGYLGRDRLGFDDLYGVSWGNQSISARWNHIFNPKLFSNLTFYTSSFQNRNIVDLVQDFGYVSRSNIRHTGIKQDFSYFINPSTQLDFGYDINRHRYFFGEVTPTNETSVIQEEFIDPSFAIETSVYVGFEKNIGDRIDIYAGLRYSRFDNVGPGRKYIYDTEDVLSPETSEENIIDSVSYDWGEIINTYQGLEPRFSLRYSFNNNTSAKVSYNRTRQYLNQMSNTNTPSPVDMWAPVNSYIPPQIGDQIALGLFKNFDDNTFETSIEGYYKFMDNQVEFKPLANLLLNDHLETEVLLGTGISYGAEVFIRKKKGRFTGWTGYTLSNTTRETPGINLGEPYPASHDRRHDFSIVGNYKFNELISVSANWVYSSGVAYTFPVGKYEKDGFLVPYYSTRNGFRLPPTHRLDISATFFRKMSPEKKNESSFNFSIYNVYNRKNTYAYIFRQNQEDRSQTEVVKIYLFSIIPSFTYNFKF